MKKKIILIIAIAGTGLLSASLLTIWALISLFSYGSDKIRTTNIKDNISQLETNIKPIYNFKPLNCWNHIQTNAHIGYWLEKPLSVNLKQLKSNCFQEFSEDCEKPNCHNSKLNDVYLKGEDFI